MVQKKAKKAKAKKVTAKKAKKVKTARGHAPWNVDSPPGSKRDPQSWWHRRDDGYLVCDECGLALTREPLWLLDHLVGHLEDDGLRVPETALASLILECESYDQASLELARQFLHDEPEAKSWHETLLAGAIQSAVEEWLATNPIGAVDRRT